MNKSNDIQFRVRIAALEKSNRELRTFINNIAASLNDLPDWKYRIEQHAKTLAEFTIRVKQLELPKITVTSSQEPAVAGMGRGGQWVTFRGPRWWQFWK